MAALFFSSHLFAQQDSSALLNEVVITAHKSARKQSETGKVVTVIGRDQLERSGGRQLGDVLNTVAGVTIIGSNNAPGTNLTSSIRGASAGNTLILLDGIPVSDPSVISNYFDLNFISIDQVERIEILKGGQSTLYGSDAVAGVINIITRKNGKTPLKARAGLAGGSYGTFKQDLGVNGQYKRLNYSIGYTHLGSKGFSSATDSTGDKGFDRDGMNQHASQLQLGYQLSTRWRLQVMGRFNQYRADLDAGGFTDERDYIVNNKQAQGGMGLVYQHEKGSLQINYNFNYVERRYTDDSSYRSNSFVDFSRSGYIGRTHFAEAYHTLRWKQWELLTGFDFRAHNTYQYYYSEGPFGPYESGPWTAAMEQYSPYASLLFKTTGGFQAELGGRLNIHSEYGSNFTFNLNPSYRLNATSQVFANLYTAFKAPTLYQLFDPFAGNTALEPEKGLIAETGISFMPVQKLDLRVVGFWRQSNNTIQYITVDPVNFISRYQNISEQTNYGVELEGSYQAGKWTIRGNYTYTDGRTQSPYDGTGAALGKDSSYFNLYRIPRHALNLQVGYAFSSRLFVNLQNHTISDREEFIYGSTPLTLKGYTLVDLYGEYRIKEKLKLFIDLRNITNTRYTDWLGFNTRRFNFMLGVSWEM